MLHLFNLVAMPFCLLNEFSQASQAGISSFLMQSHSEISSSLKTNAPSAFWGRWGCGVMCLGFFGVVFWFVFRFSVFRVCLFTERCFCLSAV